MAFSIDLKHGKFSKVSMSEAHYSALPEITMKYDEDWKFDSSTFFSLGQEGSTATYAIEYTNIILEDKYHSPDSLWAILVGNLDSIQTIV